MGQRTVRACIRWLVYAFFLSILLREPPFSLCEGLLKLNFEMSKWCGNEWWVCTRSQLISNFSKFYFEKKVPHFVINKPSAFIWKQLFFLVQVNLKLTINSIYSGYLFLLLFANLCKLTGPVWIRKLTYLLKKSDAQETDHPGPHWTLLNQSRQSAKGKVASIFLSLFIS